MPSGTGSLPAESPYVKAPRTSKHRAKLPRLMRSLLGALRLLGSCERGVQDRDWVEQSYARASAELPRSAFLTLLRSRRFRKNHSWPRAVFAAPLLFENTLIIYIAGAGRSAKASDQPNAGKDDVPSVSFRWRAWRIAHGRSRCAVLPEKLREP